MSKSAVPDGIAASCATKPSASLSPFPAAPAPAAGADAPTAASRWASKVAHVVSTYAPLQSLRAVPHHRASALLQPLRAAHTSKAASQRARRGAASNRRTARAGNRHFWQLGALCAHTKPHTNRYTVGNANAA